MLIKKRWAWLMSVMLLGFLARADGREVSDSLSIVEPPVKNSVGKGPLFETDFKATGECIIDGKIGGKSVSGKVMPGDSKSSAGVEQVVMIVPEEDKPVKPVGFPYAIDLHPSVVHISAMLSYCVYHGSLSVDECKEFWEQSCDKDAFHQFQLNGWNTVTVCKNDDRVYVAFAGTQSGSDIAVDAGILSGKMNFSKKNMSAHGGFIARSRQYSDWVMEKLSSIQGIDRRELVLTGHSLGAALATLLVHEVYEGLDLGVSGGVSNSLNQVKVVGFGSPSVLLDPAGYFLGHLNHLRFSNPYDPVATAFARWSGYSHVGVELAIPDRPARQIARAAPYLSGKNALKLLRHLPISYWDSLPPIPRTRLDTGLDVHTCPPYIILAYSTLDKYQSDRHIRRSLTSLTNTEKVLSKRIAAPVTCKLENGKVICISNGTIIAKFKYASDAQAAGEEVDACMSGIVSTNFVPGVTVNAGVSIVGSMSPITAASEALVLDISTEDKWYERMPSKMLAAVYLDGHTPFPATCDRKPTFLEPSKTLSAERALIRKSANAPKLFTVTKSHAVPATATVDLIPRDLEFFEDLTQQSWMDCRLPENSTFCPKSCNGNQLCAVMKYWGADEIGNNYWVSLSKNSNLKWEDSSASWKYTVTEKRNSWFPSWSTPNQATLTVIGSYDTQLQYAD